MTKMLSAHEWAVEIDTALAATQVASAMAQRTIEYKFSALRNQYDSNYRIYAGRKGKMTNAELLAMATEESRQEGYAGAKANELLNELEAAQIHKAKVEEVFTEIAAECTGWARFFLVTGGHIHSSVACSTCNNGNSPTQFGWLTQLSGLTEKEAVEAHGAILCTVCFPSAPVEWTNKYELDAAAKEAGKCPGQRDYNAPSRTGYTGNWGTCSECGQRITTTSTGKLRAHKKAEVSA